MRFGKALKSRFELIKETPIRILAIAIAVVVSLCYGLVTVVAFSKIPDSVKDFPVAIVNGDKGAGFDGKRVNYGDMIIFWSMAYVDFKVDEQPGKEFVLKHFDEYAHNGAIPLLHNVSQSNAEALEDVIKQLRKKGFEFLSLKKLPDY